MKKAPMTRSPAGCYGGALGSDSLAGAPSGRLASLRTMKTWEPDCRHGGLDRGQLACTA